METEGGSSGRTLSRRNSWSWSNGSSPDSDGSSVVSLLTTVLSTRERPDKGDGEVGGTRPLSPRTFLDPSPSESTPGN